MNAREEILGRLRAAGDGATALPPVWRSRREFADLAAQFTQAVTAAKGEVRQAADWETAVTELGRLLAEINAQTVVVNGDVASADWPGRFPAVQWHLVGQTAGDLRAFCAAADAGLSSADTALAETGSVILSSGPTESRMATLLPPIHIVLLPTSRLTSDIFTWTQARQETIPANITLVSGPSKTADIEQTMAVGVHGPKRFVVIVYEDAG
ncbi:MAG: lactate utilization protein [Chloroflexi bacterium]|nr:lactate utilization protein [Chloroflexota bacterium]MBP7044202.1 lactate utilization protein [Chloroflexota bacterium]